MSVSQRAREAAREIDPLLAEEMPESEEFQRIIAVIDRFEAETLERAAKVCEAQQQVFISPEYATGQPMSSFGERFACGKCAEEVRNLIGDPQ